VLVATLSACGRKTGLEVPVSVGQSLPVTPEGQQAANPPRDADGRPERVPTQPGPTPIVRSFPLDFLLN
jgi:hypothetical protein